MLFRGLHDFETAHNVVRPYGWMEKIAHRVYEDHARFLPTQWYLEKIRLKRDIESVPISRLAHGS